MKSLWLRQVTGMLRLELRKNLLSLRALPVYLLAGLPVFVICLTILVATLQGKPDDMQTASGATIFFAVMFQFILGALYFGCVWVFMNLFRGEVIDRSLHFYFLSPLRREVLVVGKYVSALVSSIAIFGGVTVVCYGLIHMYFGAPGAGTLLVNLLRYLFVIALGCLGYGAIFMVAGLFIRNPIVPALIILGWEAFAMPWLPPLLKKVSVIFYLRSLLPLPPEADSFMAFITEPIPAWLSVPGLLIFTGITLFLAALKIRTMEISYASD